MRLYDTILFYKKLQEQGLAGFDISVVKVKIRVICFYLQYITGGTLRTVSRLYTVERKQVGYIKFIFEAYDGIAVVETIAPQTALIKLHIAPGCESDVDGVLAALGREIIIEPFEGTAEGSL